MAPVRLLDTRPGYPTVDGNGAGIGLRAAGSITEVPVSGRDRHAGNGDHRQPEHHRHRGTGAGLRHRLPVRPTGPDGQQPQLRHPATPIANAVVTQIGLGGMVCLYTYAPTHLDRRRQRLLTGRRAVQPAEPGAPARHRPGSPTVDGQDAGIGPRGAGTDHRAAGHRSCRRAGHGDDGEPQRHGHRGAGAPGSSPSTRAGNRCPPPATSTTSPATPSPTRSSPSSATAARSACSPTRPPTSSSTSTATSRRVRCTTR